MNHRKYLGSHNSFESQDVDMTDVDSNVAICKSEHIRAVTTEYQML